MNDRITLLTSDFVERNGLHPIAVTLVFLPHKNEFVTWLLIKPDDVSVTPYTTNGHYFRGSIEGLQQALNNYVERIKML